MPQQINLCIAALTPLRQRVQAKFLLQALAACLVLLGVLGTLWLWSLERSAQDYRQTLDAQATEIQSLQAAIQRSRANTGPLEPVMLSELQDKSRAVQERELLLKSMGQGLFKAGQGHSDRLQMLARSIPNDVWLTRLRADGASLEVAGFTLEPASLNAWVARLSLQPELHGLQLGSVKVSYVSETAGAEGGGAGVAVQAAQISRSRPMWSFSLQNQAVARPAAEPVSGAKP